MTERVLFAPQDLVAQLQVRNAKPKSFDAYSAKSDPRVSSSTAKSMEINEENCLRIVSQLQEVSHMVWQCLPPHPILVAPWTNILFSAFNRFRLRHSRTRTRRGVTRCTLIASK